MSDYRSMLEQLAERATPADDAFERLERRRRRRQRNRRIATAAFAFVIGVAGSFVAFEAFRGSQGRVAGGETEPFYALWPEVTLAEAQQAQDAVDSGAEGGGWRLDARVTAGRFAALALRWPESAVTVPDGTDLDGPGPVTLEVSTLPAPCPSPPQPSCYPRHANVVLKRLVRPDNTGVWSVVEVYDASATDGTALRLPFGPGTELASGETVETRFAAVAEDGTEVQAGYTYFGDCTESTSFADVRLTRATLRFRVADSSFQEECRESSASSSGSSGRAELNRELDGLVFVMIVRAGGERSYAPFDAGGPTAYEDMPIAIAAVPVHFVPAEVGAAAPNVAEITCDGRTTEVTTPQVAAEPDGVHVWVTNTSSTDLAIDFGEVGGDNARIGTHEVVWSFFPGRVQVGCWDPTVEREPSLDASFTVVDPNGYFVPGLLDCGGGGAVSGFFDYVEGALGWKGSPVDVVREHASGLLPSDDVSYADYPEQAEPRVRVVRDGAVVAVFDLSDDGHGGLLISSYQACADLGIGGVEPAPSPEYPRGWFEWCPQPPFAEPGRDWSDRASEVALRFVQAYATGDRATLAGLADPSVPPDAQWAIALSPGATPSVFGTDAHGGGLVRFGCGPDVDAYTVAVTFDDGTESASADFTLFLVLREDGWKVWGSY